MYLLQHTCFFFLLNVVSRVYVFLLSSDCVVSNRLENYVYANVTSSAGSSYFSARAKLLMENGKTYIVHNDFATYKKLST